MQEFGRLVAFLLDDAFECILCLGDHNIAGLDRQHRLGIRSIDVIVFALLRDGQLMRLSGLAAGDTLARHIARLKPIAHLCLLQLFLHIDRKLTA